jgi:hypothetical protein
MENKTLIIYDLNGSIIQQITGFYKAPNGIPYIEIVIPRGKEVVSVNIETKEPIYTDIPKSEIELLEGKISILEQENKELKEELAQIQVLITSLVSAISEK